VRFLPYSELEHHREAMARFGAGGGDPIWWTVGLSRFVLRSSS